MPTPKILSANKWHNYVQENGLTEMGQGDQSVAFRSGELIVKVAKKKLWNIIHNAEPLWHQCHKEGAQRLGKLALPFTYVEESLRLQRRKALFKIFGTKVIKYDEEEEYHGYMVQVDSKHADTLLDRLKRPENVNHALADLIKLGRDCLNHGVFLNDMAPNNLVYYEGRLRIRDIAGVACHPETVERLVRIKAKLPVDPNIAIYRALLTGLDSSIDANAFNDFKAALLDLRSEQSAKIMRSNNHKRNKVDKIVLV